MALHDSQLMAALFNSLYRCLISTLAFKLKLCQFCRIQESCLYHWRHHVGCLRVSR